MTQAAGFFSGVGGIELGFEQAGIPHIYSNDIDEKASGTFNLNSEHTMVVQNIREITVDDVPDHDVLLAGFPCQAFSVAGKRKGFDDERGNIFFDLARIIEGKKPEVILLENVKNLVSHDNGNTFAVITRKLNDIGYHLHHQVLNAKDYGNIPQNRERVYIVGFLDDVRSNQFRFPEATPLKTTLRDVIDFDTKLDDRFYYTPEKNVFYDTLAEGVTSEDRIYQWRRRYVRENKRGVSPTLTANMGTGGHNVPIIRTKPGIRKLTPHECFNLQGFGENFQLPDIALSHLYKQAGNSVAVPVIRRIAEQIQETA